MTKNEIAKELLRLANLKDTEAVKRGIRKIASSILNETGKRDLPGDTESEKDQNLSRLVKLTCDGTENYIKYDDRAEYPYAYVNNHMFILSKNPLDIVALPCRNDLEAKDLHHIGMTLNRVIEDYCTNGSDSITGLTPGNFVERMNGIWNSLRNKESCVLLKGYDEETAPALRCDMLYLALCLTHPKDISWRTGNRHPIRFQSDDMEIWLMPQKVSFCNMLYLDDYK